jgi:UDP:flavonoid glycosyltransferase YjiC (YdhE family)
MNKEDLSGAIQEVLGNPCYRDTAHRFQRTIAETHGLDRAADVPERAFQLVDEPVGAVWERSNSSARRSNN